MKLQRSQKIELCVSEDETRYVLTCLHLTKKHPVLDCPAIEATDGMQYLAVPVEMEEGDTGDYIDPSLLDKARSGHNSVRVNRGVDRDRMSVRLRKRWTQTMDKILRPRKADDKIGKYPGTAAIMPRVKAMEPKAMEKILIDAHRLAKMQDAMNARGVMLTFYGEREGMEVEPISDANGKAYGVLMPMKK